MAKMIMLAIVSIVFFGIGVTCIVWPRSIQRFFLGRGPSKMDPFYNWMKTKSYIAMLRIGGVMSLAVFILLVVALVKS